MTKRNTAIFIILKKNNDKETEVFEIRICVRLFRDLKKSFSFLNFVYFFMEYFHQALYVKKSQLKKTKIFHQH